MTILAITQARTASTRLPNKVLLEIQNKSLLQLHIERVRSSKKISHFIVATTIRDSDTPIVNICNALHQEFSRGSEQDVLDRFYQAAKKYKPDYVVRITSDCPLIDSTLIDKIITYTIDHDLDYCSNTLDPHYPDGEDVEVFTFKALEQAWNEASLQSEREHVTPYIWKNSSFKGGTLFKSNNYAEPNTQFEHIRLTVDEQRDFDLIQALIQLGGESLSWKQYVDLIEENPTLTKINESIHRNEGYQKSIMEEQKTKKSRYQKSEELLERALKTIPLGTQTFSKSKTQYPFGVSPYFIEKASGAYVWDADGNKYIDFINSLCSITLGYNDKDVMKAVQNQIKIGTIFSLPHRLEIEVSEKICEMVPCAEKVRFGKNGSDVTSGAIRVARAYTGRDHVLVCGYHGWQDWYIGSTTRDKGVPNAVKELTHKFNYNDLKDLENKLHALQDKVAAVILEPVNVTPPLPGFLEGVKSLAHRHGALFVLDETITGFRFAKGGAQEYFGVIPDLATFGKGVANGYPLSVLAGKSEVMKEIEDIFFSFTFGGELLSLAASVAVLNKLSTEPVVDHLFTIGQLLKDKLEDLIRQHNVEEIFSVSGYPVWSFFNIKDTEPFSSFILKTLLMQEMFANGILMYGTHNISYSHTEAHVEKLIKSYSHYFKKVKKALKQKNMSGILFCEPLQPLFKVR